MKIANQHKMLYSDMDPVIFKDDRYRIELTKTNVDSPLLVNFSLSVTDAGKLRKW